MWLMPSIFISGFGLFGVEDEEGTVDGEGMTGVDEIDAGDKVDGE